MILILRLREYSIDEELSAFVRDLLHITLLGCACTLCTHHYNEVNVKACRQQKHLWKRLKCQNELWWSLM